MKKYIVLISALILMIFLPQRLKADTYTPGDTIPLLVSCYDTNNATVPVLANPDSVWFKRWYRGTLCDSAKVTTVLRTGLVRKLYKATVDSLGFFEVEAVVFKQGKTGAKTWTWKVGYDSTLVKNVVTVGTNNDKDGYRLSATGVDDIWDEDSTGHLVAGKMASSASQVGAGGATDWTAAERDSIMKGRYRNSGDSANWYDNDWSNATRTLTDKAGFSLAGTQTFNNTGTWTGNLSGSVNSVTSGVTVTTNNDKTGYTASTVSDKTGYGLSGTQTFNNTGTWTGNLSGSVNSVTSGVTVTTNNDKTGYALTTAYLTKADSGSTGASYLRAKYVEDKTGYRLSSQGQVDIWITDTTGLNSGWSQFFKGRLDTDVSRIDTTIQKTAKRLAGKGNRQLYFYNSKGYMDSMSYFDAATLLSRWIFYRPADTLAPDSTYSYDY
jgi:hypothetical protein